MRKSLFALSAIVLLGSAASANAGCITGAIVGGIAGHMVGHGAAGAAAGCAVGHHQAAKKKGQNAQPAPGQPQ